MICAAHNRTCLLKNHSSSHGGPSKSFVECPANPEPNFPDYLIVSAVSRFSSGNGSLQIDLSNEESKRCLFNRLLYRSRQRGFLELDLVLGNYVEENICTMDELKIKVLVDVLDLAVGTSCSMSRSRFSSEKMQDLELRLAPSFLSKEAVLASNFSRGPPEFITIVDDDDEDDVQMYRPSSSRETIMFFPCSSSSLTESKEEDLDLRLGVRASNGHSGNSKGRDTCCWKCCKASSSQLSDFMEVKLRCTICMDTMKEETSTLCGHIFCKPCITNAVRVLKRCPTCREKLSISSIHRIYLPGATS